jgi:hypothetical protein
MNKYTWFTSKEKDGGGWYKCTAQVILSTNTLEFKDYPFYKPNRKGGHRRNAIYNAFNRIIFRSKNARQIDSTQKQEWRKTFEIQVFGELKHISKINFLDILKKGKHFKQAKRITEASNER